MAAYKLACCVCQRHQCQKLEQPKKQFQNLLLHKRNTKFPLNSAFTNANFCLFLFLQFSPILAISFPENLQHTNAHNLIPSPKRQHKLSYTHSNIHNNHNHNNDEDSNSFESEIELRDNQLQELLNNLIDPSNSIENLADSLTESSDFPSRENKRIEDKLQQQHFTLHHQQQHQHHPKRRRHRRRLPLGTIGKFFAKLTGGGKVAAAAGANSADDIVAFGSGVGGRMVKASDKVDDVLIAGGKMGKNVGRGPVRGLSRRDQYRGIDPPSLSAYTLPRDEIRKARSKALTGANLALATGGVAAGIWYFSGENTTLFIAIIGVILLISVILIVTFIIYCFCCRPKKRGYYAVNEEDMLMAFAKKLIFYMFC